MRHLAAESGVDDAPVPDNPSVNPAKDEAVPAFDALATEIRHACAVRRSISSYDPFNAQFRCAVQYRRCRTGGLRRTSRNAAATAYPDTRERYGSTRSSSHGAFAADDTQVREGNSAVAAHSAQQHTSHLYADIANASAARPAACAHAREPASALALQDLDHLKLVAASRLFQPAVVAPSAAPNVVPRSRSSGESEQAPLPQHLASLALQDGGAGRTFASGQRSFQAPLRRATTERHAQVRALLRDAQNLSTVSGSDTSPEEESGLASVRSLLARSVPQMLSSTGSPPPEERLWRPASGYGNADIQLGFGTEVAAPDAYQRGAAGDWFCGGSVVRPSFEHSAPVFRASVSFGSAQVCLDQVHWNCTASLTRAFPSWLRVAHMTQILLGYVQCERASEVMLVRAKPLLPKCTVLHAETLERDGRHAQLHCAPRSRTRL